MKQLEIQIIIYTRDFERMALYHISLCKLHIIYHTALAIGGAQQLHLEDKNKCKQVVNPEY